MLTSWDSAQESALDMPFAFALIGVMMLTAGVRGTSGDLVSLLGDDLRGDNSFIYWMLAIAALGALGYVDTFRPLSRGLLLLVLVVLVLKEGKQTGSGGLFQKFTQAVGTITEAA
jgi:hypothetical protein